MCYLKDYYRFTAHQMQEQEHIHLSRAALTMRTNYIKYQRMVQLALSEVLNEDEIFLRHLRREPFLILMTDLSHASPVVQLHPLRSRPR